MSRLEIMLSFYIVTQTAYVVFATIRDLQFMKRKLTLDGLELDKQVLVSNNKGTLRELDLYRDRIYQLEAQLEVKSVKKSKGKTSHV
jgi:hypothetical protein